MRIALGMSGVSTNDCVADIILTVQNEMKILKGKFSLRDGARIEDEVRKTYFKTES